MLAESDLRAPSVAGLTFKPDVAKYLAYPESKMDEMGLFTPGLELHHPDAGQRWLEKIQPGVHELSRT